MHKGVVELTYSVKASRISVNELQLDEHGLNKTEVTYGLIYVTGIRDYFPPPGEKIVVCDDEGKKYTIKMHSSAARIDGLTDWHKTHQTKMGDTVTIVLNPDRSVKLS